MPYKDLARRRLSSRGATRTGRHGNWRQTYVDCMGVCVARTGDGSVCGETRALELHELFGENGRGSTSPKFQIRILLCNRHHALIEDRLHCTSLISS